MAKSIKIIRTFSLDKAVLGPQLGIHEEIHHVGFAGGACAPDASFHGIIRVQSQKGRTYGFFVIYTDDTCTFQKIPDDHPILRNADIIRLDDGFLMCRGVEEGYLVTREGLEWSPIHSLEISNRIIPSKTSLGIEVFFGIGQYHPISLSGDVGFVRMEAPEHAKLLAMQLDRKRLRLEWQLWPSCNESMFAFFQKRKAPSEIRAEQMIELHEQDFPIKGNIQEPQMRIADCTAWHDGQAYCLSNGVDKFSKVGDKITAISRISENGAVLEHLMYRDHMADRAVRSDRNAYFKNGAAGHFVDSNSKVVLRLLDPHTERWDGPLEIFDLEKRTTDQIEVIGECNPLWLQDCKKDRYWFVDGHNVTVAAS